jgi:hypothetical protein
VGTIDEQSLCRIDDLQGRSTCLKGDHASVTVALEVELLGQTQHISIELDSLVKIVGLHDETQLSHRVPGCHIAHLNAPVVACPQSAQYDARASGVPGTLVRTVEYAVAGRVMLDSLDPREVLTWTP